MNEKEIKNRLRRLYYNIKNRCYNPNGTDHKNYYDKGIIMCDEWLSPQNGFNNFYLWAINNGYKYIPHKKRNTITIDRIDNNKGYFPENCRWVKDKEQARNKSNNRIVEYQGNKYTMIELSEKLNISYFTLVSQFRRKSKNIGKTREKRTIKKIAQYTLDGTLVKIWNSGKEIERNMGIDHSRISKCCRHIQGTQKCCGYKWEFID